MLIISKSLSNIAKKALIRVNYEYGEGYGLKVMGAWLTVEKDNSGEEIAVFYTSIFEDYFDIDIVEKSLKFYVGELEKPFFTPPIEVLKDPVKSWREKQGEIITSLKEDLIQQGKDEADATIEAMFLGSGFLEVTEGTKYRCMNAIGIKNIIDLALKKYNNLEIRIEKSSSEDLDKFILISILKVE